MKRRHWGWDGHQVRLGDADAMIAGTPPRYSYHREMQRVASIVGMQPGVRLSRPTLLPLPYRRNVPGRL
eukprot:7711401-Pyramimonas_sp.AAC.1